MRAQRVYQVKDVRWGDNFNAPFRSMRMHFMLRRLYIQLGIAFGGSLLAAYLETHFKTNLFIIISVLTALPLGFGLPFWGKKRWEQALKDAAPLFLLTMQDPEYEVKHLGHGHFSLSYVNGDLWMLEVKNKITYCALYKVDLDMAFFAPIYHPGELRQRVTEIYALMVSNYPASEVVNDAHT